jgi:hypothetical protein
MRCDARSFLQVYGGAISIMIGSYSWSSNQVASSSAQSGDTYCSVCTVNVSDVVISNSVVVSKTTSKLWAAFHALQFLRCVCGCACVL